MAFWGSGTGTEPRRNFKFLVHVANMPVWVVKKVNLPEIEVGVGEHKFLNHTFKFPGTVKYNDITFTVVDSINQKISQNIITKFANSGYNIPGEENAAQESLITKQNAQGALGGVTIKQLGDDEDGESAPISFQLSNAWISKLKFPGNLDYGSEDLSEIEITLKYDFFKFLDESTPIRGFGA